MNRNLYYSLLGLLGIGFTVFFFTTMGPPFLANPDLLGAFGAGFVNVYSTGYSVDVIVCWLILAVWILHERGTKGIRHGWVCILLGAIPGVATGFTLYLFLRHRQSGE